MTEFVIKDSGKREDMETGSRRDSQEGKSRPDLMNPLVARRVGMHYANGCKKYGERNFELGQKSSRYLASLERHLLDYKEGLKDEDHLAAIVWNAQQLILNQEMVERGIYDREIMDETDYRDHEGFWTTVGDRALKFNDALRAADKKLAEQVTQKLLELNQTHTIDQCQDEQCDGTCDQGDPEHQAPLPKGQTLVMGIGAGIPTRHIDPVTLDDDPEVTGTGCRGCLSYDKPYTDYPCEVCRRSKDVRLGTTCDLNMIHDYYSKGSDI